MSVSPPARQRSQVRRVLLCGRSLFISGLRASLGAVPRLDLQRVDAEPENIRASIVSWQPDVVILEAAEMRSASALLLLQEFPQLRLVSLDIEDNRLLVFSGSASYEPSPEELLQVIEGEKTRGTRDGNKIRKRGEKG